MTIEPNIPKLKQIFSHCAEKGIENVNVSPGASSFSYGFFDASRKEITTDPETDSRICHTLETANPFYPRATKALERRPEGRYLVEIEIEDLAFLIQKGLWTRTAYEDGIGVNPVNVRQALDLL